MKKNKKPKHNNLQKELQQQKWGFLAKQEKLKAQFNKRKIFYWEELNKSLLKVSYSSEFLLGGSSSNTNIKWRSNFLMSKNNIEIFNIVAVRARLVIFYASFKWISTARLLLGGIYQNVKFMFASHSTVYASLMTWAGLLTQGVSSSNRWLPGRVSAQTNLEFLPHYLFVPDPDENAMITREAWQRKIPVISINNSDSQYTADLAVYGNNKSFKLVFKVLQLVVRIAKNKKKVSNSRSKKISLKKNYWFNSTMQKN